MSESLFSSNEFQIQDLTVEAPRDRENIPFVFERDISQEDWDTMVSHVRALRQVARPGLPYTPLASLILIAPERQSELNIDELALHMLEEDIHQTIGEYTRGELHIYSFLHRVSQAKIIAGRQLNLTDPPHNDLYEGVKREMATFTHSGLMRSGPYARIAFPGYASDLLTEEVWQKTQTLNQAIRNAFEDNPIKKRAYSFSLAEQRLAFPEKARELRPPKDFNTIARAELAAARYRPEDLMREARKWAILSADKIIIDDNGVRLVQPAAADIATDTPTLPEQRRY